MYHHGLWDLGSAAVFLAGRRSSELPLSAFIPTPTQPALSPYPAPWKLHTPQNMGFSGSWGSETAGKKGGIIPTQSTLGSHLLSQSKRMGFSLIGS